MIKKILIILLLFVSIISIVGCKEKQLEIVGEGVLEVGTSIVLTHNFDYSEEKIWSSSDTNIAEVYDGMVIANNIGEVTITLTIGNYVATKEIQVIGDIIQISITGLNTVVVTKKVQLTVELSSDTEEEIIWKSEDDSIASVNKNGLVRGVSIGKTKIYASVLGNISEFIITVIPNNYYPGIIGKNIITINEQVQFDYDDGFGKLIDVVWSVSDESVATISDTGLFIALKVGKVIVKISSIDNVVYSTFVVEVVLPAPSKITINGESELIQGHTINLDVDVQGEGVSKELVWTSSNPKVAIVYHGIVLGVTPGKTTIKATSIIDETVYGSIEITVNKFESEEPSKSDLDRVNKIIDNMTLSQKVGQMFVVGLSGTTMNQSLSDAIETYNFGNVIYLAYNVTNPSTLSILSNDIQNKMVRENTVPGFITIDQEGGRVVRLTNGGTHFISNMAVAASNDTNNAYLVGKAIGQELINYGINCDFAPVLDVNNNPKNPIIGIRSYSDNPVLVALYGNNMISGLQEANVMGCSKHFPGHGNTSIDSHYGLPTITSNKNELYQTELAPFISAIANGIDSIMTTHIIFNAIDDEYPATLSEKVITNLLREELGFNGIIYTDGMEMGALTNHFGSYDKTAVMAVKAGVDILTYTSINNPIKAHNAIMKAVENGEITEERIDESVRRILLKKLKYNVLDNYLSKNNNIDQLLKSNEELNNKIAMESVTQVIGEFNGLDKNRSTLIISPNCSYSLGDNLKENAFASYAANYLKSNGHENVDYLVVDENISETQNKQIMDICNNYDQVVIAMSNVKTSSFVGTSNLMYKLTHSHKNVIVIALNTPYDYLSYLSVTNYICVYGYQKASVIALSKYLNGEFEASGISPINEEIFN